MDDGCFAGWRVVAGIESIFLTSRVAALSCLLFGNPTYIAHLEFVDLAIANR